MNAHQN